MKLDATDLRYVTSDEFRVLTAVGSSLMGYKTIPGYLSDSAWIFLGGNGLQEP